MKFFLTSNFIFSYLGLLLGIYKIYLLFFLFLYSMSFFLKQVYSKSMNRIILKKLFLIYIFYFGIAFLSFLIILLKFDYRIYEVTLRYLTQNISLILVFFQVYLGFLLFQYIFYQRFLNIFLFLFLFLLTISIYQIFAFNIGLPYVGQYVFDKIFGLRPSSFSGEPKYYSAFLVISLFFLKDLFFYSKKIKIKFFYLLMVLLTFYIFLMTGSGNGYLSFLILTMSILFIKNKKIFIIWLFILLILFILFINNYENLNLRPSHIAVFDAIRYGNISFIDVFDDLLILPIMAWIENPIMLFFGFGEGLMHFYAFEFIEYATWLDKNTYIDGNIALISNISNFGFFFSLILLIYIIRTYDYLLRNTVDIYEIRVLNFLFYNFIVGYFVGGNISLFFYGSIGAILYIKNLKGIK